MSPVTLDHHAITTQAVALLTIIVQARTNQVQALVPVEAAVGVTQRVTVEVVAEVAAEVVIADPCASKEY